MKIKDARSIKKVYLNQKPISIEEFVAVARYGAKVVLTPVFCEKTNKACSLMEKLLEENRRIYGVTTGFGDNVSEVISSEDVETLQKNIVLSHACSVGEPLKNEFVRAIQLMWLLSLGKGYSAVRLKVFDLIVNLLNKEIVPFAPGEGSVGYLAVEAHIALVLLGEGQA